MVYINGALRKSAFVAMLLASWAMARAQEQVPAALANSPQCKAVLEKIVLTKKAKIGDPVVARVADTMKLKNGTEIPKGSHLLGKVTEVKAKADSDGPAKLGLLFSKAQLKDGKEIPVAMVLVSVAPPWQGKGIDGAAADNKMSGMSRTQNMSGGSASDPASANTSLSHGGLGIRGGGVNAEPDSMQPGMSYIEGVNIATYASMEPGTVLVAPKGSFYVDQGSRLLLMEP